MKFANSGETNPLDRQVTCSGREHYSRRPHYSRRAHTGQTAEARTQHQSSHRTVGCQVAEGSGGDFKFGATKDWHWTFLLGGVIRQRQGGVISGSAESGSAAWRGLYPVR